MNTTPTLRRHFAQAGKTQDWCAKHQAEFRRLIKELEAILTEFQRLLREQQHDPESEPIRIRLGTLKRRVSERLPVLLQRVGPALMELEFWQPGVLSTFHEISLYSPDVIQGPATWLGYLGQLRAVLLEAIEPEAGRAAGGIVSSHGNEIEEAPPAIAQRQGLSHGGPEQTDPHLTPKELGELWSLDQSTVRRLFRDEPGVLRIPHLRRRGKRDYVSLRIPASVAARVHERRSRSLFKI